MAEYYLGVITGLYTDEDKGITKEYHMIKVDIPGFGEDLTAFPKCGDINEPKVGDAVLCLDLDPLYHSYLVYETIKENGVIGFRSSGKLVDITPEKITMAVYKDESENERNSDNSEKSVDDFNIISSITMDNEGNISIYSSGKLDIQVGDDIKMSADSFAFKSDKNNGGAVNIKVLREFLTAIQQDLVIAQSGANLGAKLAKLVDLEDTNFKH